VSNDQGAPETKGVTVELLATVDLGPEIEGMAGRELRMRMVTVEPGGGRQQTEFADDAFRFARFERAEAASALAYAVRWLDEQPPGSREIVLAGVWRRGSIVESDLSIVPASIGLRFAPADPRGTDVPSMVSVLARRDGTLVRIDREVQLSADATTIREAAMVPMPHDRIRVVAAAVDQPLAAAAFAAALEAGVPWTRDDRRVVLVWPGGAVPDPSGADLIHVARPATPANAASAIVSALEARTPAPSLEPVLIPREQLDEWSRAPGTPPVDAPLADEGDRRWLWALALVLIGVEQWLRSRIRVGQPVERTDVRAA